MGACSSKPKTTEFEGSLEPRKPTDVAADQPQETERSLENLADDHGKEPPVRAGEGEGEGVADTSTEAVKTTREPDVGKDDGPLREVPLSSAEGTSAEQGDVLGEEEAANKKANDEVEQKESKGNGVADEVVQKVDVGSAVADIARVNKEGAQEKADESVISEAKTCEDKAVVSEETGSSRGEASYVDKAVALEAPEAPETPEKRNIIVPEEESSSVLNSIESAGIESPIIGVVQPVELMKEDDVSKSVATELAKHGEIVIPDLQEDSNESLAREAGNGDGHAPATEDVQKDELELAEEASSEVNKAPSVVVIAPASVVETLPSVSALETLAPVEADPLKDGEEGTLQPQGDAPSDAVVNVSPSTTNEEYPTDTRSAVPLDESVVIHSEDSHADTVGDEAMQLETPQTSENIDPEVSSIELKTAEAPEESIKEKGGLVVGEMDASNGHALASEEAIEDGSSKGTSGERAPEREEKAEQMQVPTGEPGKEGVRKPLVEHAISGDFTFEDASDAPLKLEASNSIEPGQVPS